MKLRITIVLLTLIVTHQGFSQASGMPVHFHLKSNSPIYFSRTESITDSVYNVILEQLNKKGLKLVDSTMMLKLYMDEITLRRNRLKPDELVDQNKLNQIMFGGRTAVQILRITVNFLDLTRDSLSGISVSITQLPTLKNKSYREVQFIPKSHFPTSVKDGIEELLDVISTKKE